MAMYANGTQLNNTRRQKVDKKPQSFRMQQIMVNIPQTLYFIPVRIYLHTRSTLLIYSRVNIISDSTMTPWVAI